MSCSSLATTSITSALSATASRPMAPSTRSTEPRAGLAGAGGGAEGEEWAELWPEPELGEGVSRVTETAASSAGRSAVMMEDTARRLGGRLNREIYYLCTKEISYCLHTWQGWGGSSRG